MLPRPVTGPALGMGLPSCLNAWWLSVWVFAANNANKDFAGAGVPDSNNAFPVQPYESLDMGRGKNTDSNDDGDGHGDIEALFSLRPHGVA